MQLEELQVFLGKIYAKVRTPFRYKRTVGVKEPIYLEDVEIKRLLAFAARYTPRGVPQGVERNTALLALAINTGLRVRELHFLNIDDVDLESRWVRVFHGKGNKYRRIPLNQETADLLRSYWGAKTTGPAFVSRKDKRMAVRTIQWLVGEYCEHAGIAKTRDGQIVRISPHKLRHTFGTQLARRNVQQAKIQEMMGHSRRETTDKYVHAAGTHEDVESLSREVESDTSKVDKLERKLDAVLEILQGRDDVSPAV